MFANNRFGRLNECDICLFSKYVFGVLKPLPFLENCRASHESWKSNQYIHAHYKIAVGLKKEAKLLEIVDIERSGKY
jgi:hypothetical protein